MPTYYLLFPHMYQRFITQVEVQILGVLMHLNNPGGNSDNVDSDWFTSKIWHKQCNVVYAVDDHWPKGWPSTEDPFSHP